MGRSFFLPCKGDRFLPGAQAPGVRLVHTQALKGRHKTRGYVPKCRPCRAWVPAVLRNNVVPTKILFETCNLNNPRDAALMQDPRYRQGVAEAFVAALDRYYSKK